MANKQISGGIILSFLSQFVSIIVGLLYTPIMIRILGQNEYGLYQLVLSVVNYLNLMNLGFNGAYIRYFSLANNDNDKKRVSQLNGMFLTVFIVISILCCIAGAILFCNIHILGDNLTSQDYIIAKRLLFFMVLNLAISFPNSLFIAYMSANEDFIWQKFLNIINNILNPILCIPLLMFGYGSVGIVIITCSLTLIRFIINYLYCIKRLKMKIKYGFFDITIFRDLLGFTFFIFLSDLVDQLNSNIDKLLLGRITGTIAVAIYSVGFSLKNYYTSITWIIPEMYIPKVNRLAIEDDKNDELNAVFIKTARLNNYIVVLVISGFILFGSAFISMWVGNGYEDSYYVTVILLISGYVPAIQSLGTNIQNAKNMHRMRSIVYLCVAILNVVVSIYLIRFWGVIGTAVGTLIAVLLGHVIFMNVYYHKVIKLNMFKFWKQILKSFPSFIIAFIFGILISKFIYINSWVSFFCSVLLYSMVYFISIWLLSFNTVEKEFIKNITKKLLSKFK